MRSGKVGVLLPADKVTIKIPRELYLKLKEIVRDTGFSSVTEFIVFTMRMVAAGGEVSGKDEFDRRVIREVRERLKRLGYFED